MSILSLVVSVFIFATALLLFSYRHNLASIPKWNFLTINVGVAAVLSLSTAVTLAALSSSDVVRFEILPVPN